MSQSTRSFEKAIVAGEDLSAKQFFIAQLSAAGLLEVGEGATDLLVGVLQDGAVAGQAGTYRFIGTTKVKAGGPIGIGAYVTSDANGKAVATTTNGAVVIGRALEAADTDDIIEIQLGIHKAWFA